MGRNLPDHVSIGDPDAPWNQNHPEPNIYCPECEWTGRRGDLNMNGGCPSCGNEELEDF